MPVAIAVLQRSLPLRLLPILRKIFMIMLQVVVPLLLMSYGSDRILGRVQIGPANLSIASILDI